MSQTTTIIGGGIAGLTTAFALKQKGFDVTLFEAAPKIKALGAGLGLGANAMLGFRKLGIEEEVAKAGKELSGIVFYDRKGGIISQSDTRKHSEESGAGTIAIHRATLHECLHHHVGDTPLHLNKKVTSIQQHKNSTTVLFEDGTSHEASALIVADGIHSPIRQQLIPGSTPRYAGYTCWRGVTENPGITLERSSETWGSDGRFGITPLANNKIYWYATINASQNHQKYRNFSKDDLAWHFRKYHAPIPDIIDHTKDHEIIWNDIMDLKPIPHYSFGNCVLIGDAAHATTPNLGQGACQAIEDAVVLADEYSINPDNPSDVFKRFEQRRLERTHQIVNASRMMGKVAQTSNPLLMGIRNLAFRLTPESVSNKQVKKIMEVDF